MDSVSTNTDSEHSISNSKQDGCIERLDSTTLLVSESIQDSEIITKDGISDCGYIDFQPQDMVVGPDGQPCANQQILDQVLKRYTHIHTNIFRGGANGKIQSECMVCDCRFNPCISFC